MSQQIAKDAILWVNSFNYLLTETCRSLDADSLKLRLYYLEASRIIVVEIAAFKNSVCSLKFLVLKIYQKLWLRTRGKLTIAHSLSKLLEPKYYLTNHFYCKFHRTRTGG